MKYNRQEIYNIIVNRIITKEYVDKIPTRNDLMDEFNCSESTIKYIFFALKNKGFINTIKGKGTFVSGNYQSNKIKSFDEEFTDKINDEIITEINYIGEFISGGAYKIKHYEKIRTHDGKIVEHSNLFINSTILPKLTIEDIKSSLTKKIMNDSEFEIFKQNIDVEFVKNSDKKISGEYVVYNKLEYYNVYEELVVWIDFFSDVEFYNLKLTRYK